MLPTDWGEGWPHVWLGTTTENQEEANRRIPHLVAIPAAVRFLSVEPMLEPVDITPWLVLPSHDKRAPISWIIVGGESGGGARPMHPDWVRGLRDQAHTASAKLFVKQIGSKARPEEADHARRVVAAYDRALAEGFGAVTVDGASA